MTEPSSELRERIARVVATVYAERARIPIKVKGHDRMVADALLAAFQITERGASL